MYTVDFYIVDLNVALNIMWNMYFVINTVLFRNKYL